MREQFYLTKSIDPNNVEDESDSDNEKKFLGYITIDIATTHKDRGGDVLTKRFIDDAVKSLTVNNAFFYNHKTMDDPIGKVVSASTIPLADGEYATRLKVGISKTAEKQWALVKEGILNKGSIGFYLDDDGYEYDEDTDTLIIDKGEVVEGSLVGVPMNKEAGLIEVSKRLKTLIREKALKEQSNIETNKGDNMDIKDMETYFDKKFIDINEKFDDKSKEADVEFQKKFDEQKTEFEKSLEEFEAKNKAIELERDEFKKALSEGRKTGSGGNPDKNKGKDPYFKDDETMALKKSFWQIGSMIKSNQEFDIVLMPSSDADLFEAMDMED